MMDLKPGRFLGVALLTVLSAGAVSVPAFASTTPPASLQGRIQHIVVLMQENRSFDHYLGRLSGVHGEPAGASNPNPLGGAPITAFHKTAYCEVADLNHSWNGTHEEWDNGKMDGFTAANVDPSNPSGSRTMGYYDQRDLPFYYGLDSTFPVADHYFASVLTQTFPNRFYLLAGTSFGHIANDPPGPTGYTQKTVFELLDAAHVSWKIYYSQVAFADLFAYVRAHAVNEIPISQYYIDAQNGNLPQVAFVDPIFAATNTIENDEHPPSNVQVGENFAAKVVNALMTSPNWSSSAMFLTYDEHGGFYDHMAPPAAVTPDDIPPMLKPGDTPGAFDRYGIRVPVTVISPWAKPNHYVSPYVYDHTSILRFIEKRYGLPALTRRDAAANPMLDFFNFKSPAFATPPQLPAAPIDQAQLAACATMPSNTGV